MRQHYAKMEEYQAEVNKEKLLINEEFRRRGADFENAMQEKQKLKEEIVSANETVIKEREECDAKLEDYKKVIEQNSVIIEKLKANNNVVSKLEPLRGLRLSKLDHNKSSKRYGFAIGTPYYRSYPNPTADTGN